MAHAKAARSRKKTRHTFTVLDDVQLRLHCLEQTVTCLSIAFALEGFDPSSGVVGSTLHGVAVSIGDISELIGNGRNVTHE